MNTEPIRIQYDSKHLINIVKITNEGKDAWRFQRDDGVWLGPIFTTEEAARYVISHHSNLSGVALLLSDEEAKIYYPLT